MRTMRTAPLRPGESSECTSRCGRRGGLGQRTGAGEMDHGRAGVPAIELSLADSRRAALAAIQNEGEPLVRKDAVRAPGHEFAIPGLSPRIGLFDRDLHFD